MNDPQPRWTDGTLRVSRGLDFILSERVASAVVERAQPENCGLFVEEHNISKAGPL